jgi:hypothetical protein
MIYLLMLLLSGCGPTPLSVAQQIAAPVISPTPSPTPTPTVVASPSPSPYVYLVTAKLRCKRPRQIYSIRLEYYDEREAAIAATDLIGDNTWFIVNNRICKYTNVKLERIVR